MKSKRAMRRLILGKLYQLLLDQYSVPVSRESFLDGEFTHHELDAVLAFKSGAQIDELHRALDRLEDGTLDVCISCKGRIGEDALDLNPARRFCVNCEKELSHVVGHSPRFPVQV